MQPSRNYLLIAICSLMLGGCGQMGPLYLPPPPPPTPAIKTAPNQSQTNSCTAQATTPS